MQTTYFICPHHECGGMVEVPPNQLNCKIFRHGIYKKTIALEQETISFIDSQM